MEHTYAPPNENYDWERVEQLRRRADEGHPAAWQPKEPGDEVYGYLRRVTLQAPTAFGPAPVVELETREGSRVAVWLYHTVLRRAFERERPVLGELLLVRYLGKRKPDGGGNAYDDYRLVVDRGDARAEPDWGAIAERYDGGQVDPPPNGNGESDFRPAPTDDDIPF